MEIPSWLGAEGDAESRYASSLFLGNAIYWWKRRYRANASKCQKHWFPGTSVSLWLEILLQISKIIYLDIISANERGDRQGGKGTFPRIKEEGTRNEK